ncbi:MAG TPA: phosphate/phosphite/phosphonate ABC transporter substrate-binding protein, partial [Desulfobacteraceae bacterium]|nr:phosphate/phosphite/phosphonate ABC transporter substrate-binding protein [Desulfobacteraceae bacterium]
MRFVMKKLSIFLAFFLFLGVSCSPPPPVELETYRIGYMICNSEKETLDRFQPLTKYLGEKLGVKFELVPIHTNEYMREVDTLHFTHTNSLLYIMMHRFNGVEILAAEKRGSWGSQSQGIILARKESGIKTIEDLKGKNMIFGPMLAPTGFMSQVDLLEHNGIDPEEDLAFYTIPSGSFKHEKVIYGVLFEKYDAGAIPIFDFETMAEEGRIDPEDFVIVAKAPPIPYCNFGVTQKVDEQFAARFKEALLSLTMEDMVEFDGERVSVLARTLAEGYEDISDSDFDLVR